MRAGWFIRCKTAAMKRSDGADAIRHRGGAAHGERAGHAIAGDADLAFFVDLAALVEKLNERFAVCHGCFRRKRTGVRQQALANLRIGEAFAFLDDVALRRARIRIYNEYGITGLGETLAHLPEGGADAHNIRPDDDAGVFAVFGVNKIGVRLAVGRLNGDVARFHRHRVRRRRKNYCSARAGGEGREISPGQALHPFQISFVIGDGVVITHEAGAPVR